MREVPVTIHQVLAARLRVVCDQKLGRTTPDWIARLAKTELRR